LKINSKKNELRVQLAQGLNNPPFPQLDQKLELSEACEQQKEQNMAMKLSRNRAIKRGGKLSTSLKRKR